MEIESSTSTESPTGESGSRFSVYLPYGKSHLPADQTVESLDRITAQSSYARGVIEEAQRWTVSRAGSSARSQSDSGISTTGSSSGKIDLSSLFWKDSDTILVVDDSQDMRQYLHNVRYPLASSPSLSTSD